MIWLDAHLSPALATWLTTEFEQPAAHLRQLGLRHAKDREIFAAARKEGVILLTKDADFVDMVRRRRPSSGSPAATPRTRRCACCSVPRCSVPLR